MGKACAGVFVGVICIGFARAVSVVLTKGNILDSVIYGLSIPLKQIPSSLSALGMLVIQSIINFFIPSGVGQALVTMPILAPVGEMVGVSRQVSVLAYQFGDGFSNIFWPTSVFMMCGIMRLPINKWYKFVTPLFGMIFVAEIVLLIIAMLIGY